MFGEEKQRATIGWWSLTMKGRQKGKERKLSCQCQIQLAMTA